MEDLKNNILRSTYSFPLVGEIWNYTKDLQNHCVYPLHGSLRRSVIYIFKESSFSRRLFHLMWCRTKRKVKGSSGVSQDCYCSKSLALCIFSTCCHKEVKNYYQHVETLVMFLEFIRATKNERCIQHVENSSFFFSFFFICWFVFALHDMFPV